MKKISMILILVAITAMTFSQEKPLTGFLFDIEGFEQAAQEYFLVFDPQRPWPDAWISLSISDLTETIRIKSKYVDVKEDSI